MVPFYAFMLKSNAALPSGNIHVVVEGIDNIGGQLGILLFEQEDGFPSDERKALQMVLLPLDGASLRYSFLELPYGKYAVSVMHDTNMNDKLDTNFLGIPKEGVGISNNVKGTFGAPKFKDASFDLNGSDVTTTIELSY
jgi:uncharacterized protein (DUF2141 family)